MKNPFKAIFGLTVFMFAFISAANAESSSVFGGDKDISDITKRVYSSVVKVEARNGVRKVATGVCVDKQGHVVTTALISPRDEEIFITTSDGKQVDAEFLGMDAMTHLAVVKAKEGLGKPIDIGTSKDLEVGSWIGVVSISPEGTPHVSQGIVSSVGRDGYRLNVWVIPGSSGSPVVDDRGRMVGLLRGVYADESPVVFEFKEKEVVGSGYMFSRAESPASGMAMAVPIDVVERVAAEIKEKGKVERGWLGVQIAESEDGHVEIVDVEKESPAELAGLEEGDIILEMEGQSITSTGMLAKEIRSRKPGDDVKLKIERKDKTETVKVKLGEYTEYNIFQEFESKFPRLFPKSGEKFFALPEGKSLKVFPNRMGKRRFIGVYLQEMTPELSEYFGVKEGMGLLISKVTEGSPAEKAGLKVGDVIVTANGDPVENAAELSDMIQGLEKGDKIEIEYVRDKKKRTVSVEVDEEETGIEQYFFSTPEGETGIWQGITDKARLEYDKWQDRYSQEYKEKAERLRKEMESLSEKAMKEAKEKSEKAQKLLRTGIKKYRGIKV